ncbi:MAG: zinc ribbon domain-containing protein [Candidatus Xenobium sp.]|jgi:hypothetical protein
MARKDDSSGRPGPQERRRDRNQAVTGAWFMLLVGIFTLLRPLLHDLPPLFTSPGLSLFTSLYHLTGWYADGVATCGLGILMVFGAIAAMRDQARWLQVGVLLLSVDLILLILSLVTGNNIFYGSLEGLLSLAIRVVIWWIVLRGSRAARFEKPAADADTAPYTPTNQAEVPPRPRFCSRCGSALNPIARFCRNCGSPLAKRPTRPVSGPDVAPQALKPTARQAVPQTAGQQSVRPTIPPASSPKTRRLALVATLLIATFFIASLVVAVPLVFVYRADIVGWIESSLPLKGTLQTGAKVSLNRTESPATGSKEVKIEPIPGFTIHAPENALDQDRTFTVKPLVEDEITALEKSIPPDFTPLNAYHIEAGMTAEQCTPGYIRLSFDLAELGVDETLWNSMAVMRINGEENDFLASSVVDGKLTAFTKKNSVIVTGTLLTIATALGNYAVTSTRNGWYGKYLRDEPAYETMIFRHVYYPCKSAADMTGSTDTFSLNSINEVIGDKYYRLVWPDILRPADPDEVNRARGELAILLDKYGLGESGMIVADRGELRQARLRAQIELNKDEKYLDLLKRTVHNEEWIRNNLWPPEVRATAEAIDIADRYLFQDRAVKFDRPWNVTDILVLSPQPKKMTSDMYAMEVDLSFTAPYIMVNAAHGSIPSSKREFSVKARRFGIENLALTLVHEMVHVLQDGSGLPDPLSNSYLWLYEAEAVLVENEAYKALQGKVMHGDYTTDRSSWYTLASSLDVAVDQGTIDQNRGYVASRFLEYLRDRYYASNPDAFAVNLRKDLSNYLPQFLTNRLSGSEIRATTLDAVVRQTSSNWRELAAQYTQFCQENTAAMLEDFRFVKRADNQNKAALETVYKTAGTEPTAVLSPRNPLYKLNSRPGEHLSVSFTEIQVDKLSAEERDKALLALLTPRYTGKGEDQIKVSWSGDATTFKAYEKAVTIPLPASGLFYLRQIHDYTNIATLDSLSPKCAGKVSDILLLAPLDAPSLGIDTAGRFLKIAWKDNSRLPDLKREDGTPYLTHYRVTIQHPGRQAPIQLTPDRDRTEVEIPLADLKPDKTATDSKQEPKEYTLSVTVRQYIADNPPLVGPDGQAAEITIGEKSPAGIIGEDILGHWNIYSTYSNRGFFAPPGLSKEGLARWKADHGITGEPETRKFHVVFWRDGTFYAEVRTAEGIIDASFSGTYTSIEQKQSPGAFIYLADIEPASVINKGKMPYRNIREDRHDLKFYFVEKDGKKLLYEETTQYYLE